MKICLYFGSFNPIHIGHLIIASYVADNTDTEKVWFVISPQNPFKKTSALLNEYHRLHLVQLAIEEDQRLNWSDVEFKMPRPSYTIDTLTYLTEKYPSHQFSIIVGSDSFQNIHNWKNSELLLKSFHLCVYERPGFPASSSAANITILKAPLLEISSTEIRTALKEGKSVKYMLPEKVLLEIEKNGYYKK